MYRQLAAGLLCFLCIFCSAQAWAGPATDLDVVEKQEDHSPFHENALAVSYQTGYGIDLVSPSLYQTSPQIFSLHWQLDDVGNPGWRRGNTEWVTSFYYLPLWGDNAESRLLGAVWGPRYNFVQEGWRVVPYVEARVGFGFTDSDPEANAEGQGQDFVFTFLVGAGAKYLITDEWSAALGVCYQHWSNAGLSEPQYQNNGTDMIGPSVSVSYQF
jgi:hypothetical protein